MSGERMINQHDLADKLRQYEKWGVEVPALKYSQFMPVHYTTESDGTEVYNCGIVKQGQVIDDHGNIVDLSALDKELHKRMFEIKRLE